MDINR